MYLITLQLTILAGLNPTGWMIGWEKALRLKENQTVMHMYLCKAFSSYSQVIIIQ